MRKRRMRRRRRRRIELDQTGLDQTGYQTGYGLDQVPERTRYQTRPERIAAYQRRGFSYIHTSMDTLIWAAKIHPLGDPIDLRPDEIGTR